MPTIHNPQLEEAKRVVSEIRQAGGLAALLTVIEADVARCLAAMEACADSELPQWRREWQTHLVYLRLVSGNPSASIPSRS